MTSQSFPSVCVCELSCVHVCVYGITKLFKGARLEGLINSMEATFLSSAGLRALNGKHRSLKTSNLSASSLFTTANEEKNLSLCHFSLWPFSSTFLSTRWTKVSSLLKVSKKQKTRRTPFIKAFVKSTDFKIICRGPDRAGNIQHWLRDALLACVCAWEKKSER